MALTRDCSAEREPAADASPTAAAAADVRSGVCAPGSTGARCSCGGGEAHRLDLGSGGLAFLDGAAVGPSGAVGCAGAARVVLLLPAAAVVASAMPASRS